ncbi:SPW repeat protein [Proteobacteria bacterium 005FR1]|nr:SPW repeat protein [Proteobacteria bacterium 005FR1]
MADPNKYTAPRTASMLNVIAGAWLIISPWALGYSEVLAATWNEVVVGALVIVFAAIRLAAPDRYAGLSWINAVLGVWLIIAPWAFQYGEVVVAAAWNETLIGIAVAFLAAISATTTARLKANRIRAR